jgi:hypothetical protein
VRAWGLAAAAALAVLAGFGGGAGPVVRGNALALVDARSGRVIDGITLADEPLRVAYGAGAFWAVLPDSRRLMRFLPRPGQPRTVTFRTIGLEPYDVAAGGGAVWVADHDAFDVHRVGPGEVRSSPNLAGPQLAIGYGFGAVWTIGADDALRRLDPRSLRPTGEVADVANGVEGYEPKLAFGPDELWVSDAVGNRVVRVDPVHLRVTRRIARGGAGVALLRGQVWSTDSFGAVLRVADGPPVKAQTGFGAFDVAAGGGYLWVANRFAGTLTRVDPTTLATRTTKIGGSPVSVAYGDGYVAVAVRTPR